MRPKNGLLCLPLILFTLAGAAKAYSASGYTFTQISFPGAYLTAPQAINSSGDIAGYYTTTPAYYTGYLYQRNWHGFVMTQGRYISIDVPGATWTAAFAINDSGTVYGIYYIFPDVTEGLFQYDVATGSLTVTPPITLSQNTPTSESFSDITGINANGVAVGYVNQTVFTYALGTETSYTGISSAFNPTINSAGAIAGHGQPDFVLIGGTTSPLPDGFSALGIGPSSEILGTYLASGTTHGAVLKNGVVTFVDDPDAYVQQPTYYQPNTQTNTYPVAENASGQLVGYYVTSVPGTIGFLANPPAAAPAEKTRVYIDVPNSNSQVAGKYTIAGWASVNVDHINAVSLRLDGVLIGAATYGTPRADVCTAFANQQDCPNVGWSYIFDSTKIKDGQHVLEAIATTADGTHASASTSITIANANSAQANSIQMMIDSPSAGNTVSGKATVSGWAFDSNSQVSVEVIVDLQSQQPYYLYGYLANTGVARPDVCAVFNNAQNCATSGWNYSLDTTQFSDGTHTLTAIAFDSPYGPTANRILTTTITIANNGPLRIFVDRPTANSGAVSGDITLMGWAVDNNAPLYGVSFTIDGYRSQSSFSQNGLYYGVPRTDVCAVYPSTNNCPNVGWVGSIDTNALSNGTHVISFSAGSQGYFRIPGDFTTYTSDSITTSPITFTVNNPSSTNSTHVFIDSPKSTQVLSGNPGFSGWALDDNGPIDRVDISIDGKIVGSANVGMSRPDVCAVYPNRPICPYVGWQFSPNSFLLTNGTHTLTVTAVSLINSEATASTTFNIEHTDNNSATHIAIEAPASGGLALSGQTTFSGYALNQNNYLNGVTISVDDLPIKNFAFRQLTERTDVCATYPDAQSCPDVGWSVSFDTRSLTDGVHTLQVSAVPLTTFNQPTAVSTMFTVSNGPNASPTKSFIDNPAAGSTISGVTSFDGWAVNRTSAISSVSIWIDGVAYGGAHYGVSRTDVCAALPQENGCPEGNVGWSFAVDTTLLTNGSHTLQVQSTAADGTQQTISQQFKSSN